MASFNIFNIGKLYFPLKELYCFLPKKDVQHLSYKKFVRANAMLMSPKFTDGFNICQWL